MDVKTVRRLLLACHAAKRILAMLPDLPDGLGPRGLRILDVVAELSEQREQVCVSDVSDYMDVSRPGITRDISHLEEQGYLKKEPSRKDRRLVYVTLTEEGARVRETYVTKYHERVAGALDDFSEGQIDQAADTIEAVCATMSAEFAKDGARR